VGRIWTTTIGQFAGQRVELRGWKHRFRRLGSVSFLILRDRKGTAQVVLSDADQMQWLDRFASESVLKVCGTVVESPQAPGGVELHDPEIELISQADESPPFDLFRPGIDAHLPTQLDHAAVSLRHPARRALSSLASASTAGFRAALESMDFTEIFTPKIVAAATEGGANVFEIDYFGTPAYLAQSPQFYKQMMVGVHERVFEVGPVFRAEPHDTPRHLNQYTSLDLEIGFIEDHRTVMAVLEQVLRKMVDTIEERCARDLVLLAIELPAVPSPIPSISFIEAQQLITQATGEDLSGEPDLAPTHERWLGDWALREHGSEFLFVTGYPMVKRPFYTHSDPAGPEFSNSFDLLFRGLELVTGGQRLHRYQDYLMALESRGMSPEPVDSFLAAFRHGMPPHGGCALGLERWVARLAGRDNVRETTLFPRDLNRLTP
jgi:nondiscriminating aspartyl-tRNA synthetase